MQNYDDDGYCVVCNEWFYDPHQPACPYSDDLPIRITKRGWFVMAIGAITIAVLLALAIVEVSTNLWWTENGYCWGDMVECLNNE